MSDENERSVASTGSVDEPVAWTVDLGEGNVYDIQNFQWEAEAISEALLKNEGVIAKAVPLYRSPTLTGAERKAIESAIDCCEDITYGGAANQEAADVLKALLERLK